MLLMDDGQGKFGKHEWAGTTPCLFSEDIGFMFNRQVF